MIQNNALCAQNGAVGQQNGAAAQHPSETEDLTKEQPGDASYLAAVREAMGNLGPPKTSSKAQRGAAAASEPSLSPEVAEEVADAAVAAGGGATAAPAADAAKVRALLL